jgi:hypothetical protein
MLPIFLVLALAFSAFGADLESVGSVPSSTLDSLGDTAGGYGSGSAYDPKAGILYLTSDRGPGDGTIDYSPRLFAVQFSTSDAQSSVGPRSVGAVDAAERVPTENPTQNAQDPVGTQFQREAHLDPAGGSDQNGRGQVLGGQSSASADQSSGSKPAPGPGALQNPPTSKDPVNVIVNVNEPSSARLYKDVSGQPFTGLLPDSSDAEPRMKDGRRCLDPEGLALMKDGNLFVSEEYFPSVLQFKPDGTFLARFVPPENYLPRNASGKVDFRPMENRAEGREDNRGFEGVALSPDGKTVYAILQSGLTQDGGREAGATRLLAFDALTGTPRAEYAVRFTDPASLGERAAKLKGKNLVFSDLLCLPDGRILALERDNRGQDGSVDPKKAIFKSVCVFDLAGATDLLSMPDKPYSLRKADPKFKPLTADQPIRYVKKTLLFDFENLDLPSQGLAWDQVPEKWEGLALLAPDRLLVIADNDFLTPELTLGGKKVPFPKCQTPVDCWWFSVRLRGEDTK